MAEPQNTKKAQGKTKTPAKKQVRNLEQEEKVFERKLKIYAIYKRGVTNIRFIARELKKKAKEAGESTRGYSHEQVRKDLHEILSLRHGEFAKEVLNYKVLQLDRLNDLYSRYEALTYARTDPDTKEKTPPCLKAGRLVRDILSDITALTVPQDVSKVEVSQIAMSVDEWKKQQEERRKGAAKTAEIFDKK